MFPLLWTKKCKLEIRISQNWYSCNLRQKNISQSFTHAFFWKSMNTKDERKYLSILWRQVFHIWCFSWKNYMQYQFQWPRWLILFHRIGKRFCRKIATHANISRWSYCLLQETNRTNNADYCFLRIFEFIVAINNEFKSRLHLRFFVLVTWVLGHVYILYTEKIDVCWFYLFMFLIFEDGQPSSTWFG